MTTQPQGTLAEHPADASCWIHRADLVAYARRVLGAQSDLAEDVVQEAYVRLLARSGGIGQGPQGERPWLFRVVRNLAIDERRGAARRAIPLGEPVPDTEGSSAADELERREDAALALRQMAALPPRERRAVELDQAGVAPTAIARTLGTTPNAIHQALFRARRRLRDARAVAWGFVPLPVVRLLASIDDSHLATLASLPAPQGRMLGGAGVAGTIVAAVLGGGAAVTTLVPHHHRPVALRTSELTGQLAAARPPTLARQKAPSVARSIVHTRIANVGAVRAVIANTSTAQPAERTGRRARHVERVHRAAAPSAPLGDRHKDEPSEAAAPIERRHRHAGDTGGGEAAPVREHRSLAPAGGGAHASDGDHRGDGPSPPAGAASPSSADDHGGGHAGEGSGHEGGGGDDIGGAPPAGGD